MPVTAADGSDEWPDTATAAAAAAGVLIGCDTKLPNLKPPVTFQSAATLNGCFTVCVADKAKTLFEPVLKVDNDFT